MGGAANMSQLEVSLQRVHSLLQACGRESISWTGQAMLSGKGLSRKY